MRLPNETPSLDIHDNFNQEELDFIGKSYHLGEPEQRNRIIELKIGSKYTRFMKILERAKKEHWYY